MTTQQETNEIELPSEYDIQAQEFLDKTNTTIKWEFDGYRPHWIGEKESRLCWKYTLVRGSRSHSGTFGESIADTFEKLLGRKYPFGRLTVSDLEDFVKMVKLIRQQNDGSTIIRISKPRVINPPSAYSLLACLSTYEPEYDLDEFAEAYGYTKPSEAIRVYNAITEEYKALCAMYNEEEMQMLQEIK